MEVFKPIKPEKVVVSIRIEDMLLRELDKLSIEANISRNKFIVQCIEYAVKTLIEN